MISQRLKAARLALVFAAAVLVLRLFGIQIWQNRHYKVLADREHFFEREISANRGQIYTQDDFPLVVNKTAFLLFSENQKVKDSLSIARQLTEILFDPRLYDEESKGLGLGNLKKGMVADLEMKLENKKYLWMALFHRLSQEQKERIESLKLDGLGFEPEPVRHYPEGSLASYVLGFVGSDEEGQTRGYYGLEGLYDGDLSGRSGSVIEERGASGLPVLWGSYKEIPSQDGRDLILTLNRSLQFLVEKKLSEGVEKYQARSGTVIIMDPADSSILAMASYPNFDVGDWENFARQSEEKNIDRNLIFRNPAIAETYEPGSVLKALTISAAIDNNLVTPQTEFDDRGPLFIAGNAVDNWDKKHHGRQNVIQLLQKSNNIGAVFVGRRVGSEKLREYFLRFGLGRTTGIDLEGEDSGTIKDLSQWREIDLVTASFGQGVSVTPLQLVTAFSAIANGGVLYRPYIVREIRDRDGTTAFKGVKVQRVLDEAKARVMIDLLTAAAEGGEGKFFVLKKYRVAGKTGTAQIPVAGRYDPNKTNATFVGFLPNQPRFVMLVRLKEPSTSPFAAETSVPLWMEITKDLVNYFAIPPDR